MTPLDRVRWGGKDRLSNIEDQIAQIQGTPPVARGNRVWGLGDSLTAGAGTITPYTTFAPNQYLTWAWVLSNGLFYIENVAALAGITTTTIVSSYLPTVVAAAPAACFVLAGTNDVGGNVALATSKSNLSTIYSTLMGAGILPIAVTIPPKSTAEGDVGKLNAWIVRNARATGLPLVDMYSQLIDPATGSYLAAYDSGDHIHPNAAGAKLVGQAAVNVLKNTLAFPPSVPMLAGSNSDPNGISNPVFLTGTGSPTGWNPAGSPTVSLASDASVLGNAWSVTRAAGGDASCFSPNITASPGDKLHFACKAQATVKAVGGAFNLSLLTFNSNNFWRLSDLTEDFGWMTIQGAATFPDDGSAGFQVFVQAKTATNANFKLAQVTILNLTSLGIE